MPPETDNLRLEELYTADQKDRERVYDSAEAVKELKHRDAMRKTLVFEMISHGQAVPAVGPIAVAAAAGALARMYSTEGRFLALARYDSAGPMWRPEKVVAST